MIIALAGLAGAGKTTVIRSLERRGLGKRFHVGQVLARELADRELEVTPGNERSVRSDLRDRHGMDVFARRSLPSLEVALASDRVLLDAIYCVEERDRYLAAFGTALTIVAVVAPLEARILRLAARSDRSMSVDEMTRRDELELGSFRMGEVLDGAHQSVCNDGTLDDLELTLSGLLARMGL